MTSPTAASAVSEPSTARGRLTRERVLAAAREVFEEKGFSDARMSDVAKRAEVSHGTVYVYFDSKTALLRGVTDHQLAHTAAYLRTQTTSDPIERISEANLRYLRVYTKQARLLRVVEQAATANSEFEEVLSEFRQKHVARVADGIRRLQRMKLADPTLDPDISAAALSAMVEGYTRYSPGYDVAKVHPALTSLWLRALGLPDKAPPQP